MQNLDLNKIDKVGTWLWRMLTTALLLLMINNQEIIVNEARANYSYLEPLISNTAKIVAENSSQPEIPDAESNEYQVSCPAESDFLDDPDKVIAFMNAVEPYVESDPWKLQFLSILLLGDRDAARDYLERQFSNGYPYK